MFEAIFPFFSFDTSWPLDSHAVYLVAYARGVIMRDYDLVMMGYDDVVVMHHDDVFTINHDDELMMTTTLIWQVRLD